MWEIGSWLVIPCRTSDFQERITDVMQEMVVKPTLHGS